MGRFELANGGTIFLDEIRELELASQVKMLRVLQDRTYEVLGDSKPRRLDICVIVDTNRNLAEMMVQGRFREDLFYRVNLISVRLPALRERPQDILTLPSTSSTSCGPFMPFFSTKRDGQDIGLTLVRDVLLTHSYRFRLKTNKDGCTAFSY